MTRQKKRHHHGDLKRALLDKAEEHLAEMAPGELSLRKISTDVGVSITAPYAHFPTKDDLLVALAVRGFTRLRISMLDSLEGGQNGRPDSQREALERLALTYLRFAEAFPGLYRIMFRDGISIGQDNELSRAADAAFEVLHTTVSALPRRDGLPEVREETTIAAWAMVHGFVTIKSDNRVSKTMEPGFDPERYARLAAAYVAAGLIRDL